ncbi:RNA polymerase sigma-70 factor, ECF subfamily [Pseudomonas citronellolis]|jgi:RNA polymerase sigma-70 factor (ECF subfamily)|uniref:RNA polymerase sigma-70 factor, ECF subfamily n=1 Tax=Pseudomonas citronellolis TaxID=53408 RepID=A0AAQ1KEL8_9PSED|nr:MULTISPECIES: sigma-70 family RNA polymerase sigma factor [Pseudomonas]MCL6687398.1 sigma-70 family RNA polymerase sigma factor [Pseudomonas sp. R3.Fl]MCP1603407.1 RNA polymerase sigma-70 factor (ECF subfamily) [Pseudomonas citronellolis]MCP1644258.1 RNA polymerase sigma-70 factor (ECF subfamily) [Pseudomonas citronellolis]MCP1654598.1 RNA polymerase sigma-70 factor (ECF subfamily) [Pseudomonas citronellolis]MCP1667281.1 RNA polymerase sigma-70 factor (ECF subfamily) [Pseudomonas citronello
MFSASSHASPAVALERLYGDHHGWLFGWLRQRLGNAPDAADIAHDTYLRILSSGRTPPLADSRRYLVQVAKGLVIDLWRRQDVERAYREAIAHLPEAQVPAPETHWLIVESLLRIDAMLDGLPRQTREVFLLAQFHELTLQQIAERTGMALITVRRHIHKALVACMTACEP